MNRRMDAARFYLLTTALVSFSSGLIGVVYAIYYIREAGLDALQLVLVGTALEASAFAFEIPTGVVADTYSRRLSLIVGALVVGLAWIGEALVPTFVGIVLCEILRGLGEAFSSGAPEAWLSSEVGDERLAPVLMRSNQVARAATVAGTLLSVPVAALSINVPMLAGGALLLVVGALRILVMPERPFRAATPRSWTSLFATARQGASVVRARPLLVTILALELFLGAASEGYDRLWEAHLLNDIGFPALLDGNAVAWFAIIDIGGLLLGIAAVELVRRRSDLSGHGATTRFLLATHALRIAFRFAFALAPSFALAVGARWGGGLAAAAAGPVYAAWLTRNIDPEVRATVLSTASLCNAGGQLAGGPAVGALGRFAGVPSAILATALLLLPNLWLFARAGRQEPTEVAVAAAPSPT